MGITQYDKGYNAGYRAGLRYKAGKATPARIVPVQKSEVGHSAIDADRVYRFMVAECPGRGGYMFEGARPAFESGEYKDAAISEMLNRGWIVPHDDPQKGWVPVVPRPHSPKGE